jgi:orotidine-5'-phosphate decarboxylase
MALEPNLLTIHAAGGRAMMEAAAEAAHSTGAPPVLLAVTVLTSLDERALEEIGQRGPAPEQALRLAQLAQRAGIGGAVCSAHEIGTLKAGLGSDFRLAVPGLRLDGIQRRDDQARVMTPAEAVRRGADWLVVGRPVTAAPDPAQALEAILNEIAGAAP